MEATPLNPSDFLLVRGTYGVRPAFPSPSRRRGCWTSLQNRIELGCFQITPSYFALPPANVAVYLSDDTLIARTANRSFISDRDTLGGVNSHTVTAFHILGHGRSLSRRLHQSAIRSSERGYCNHQYSNEPLGGQGPRF